LELVQNSNAFILSMETVTKRISRKEFVRKTRSHISSVSAILWMVLGLVFGVLPTLSVFLWVSLDFAFPFLSLQWWPMRLSFISPQSSSFLSLLPLMIFDTSLFLFWGFFHSFFSSIYFHQIITVKLKVATEASRMIFYLLNALTSLALLTLWQNTGIVLWKPSSLSEEEIRVLNAVVFWLIMSLNLLQLLRLDMLEFIGVRQLLGSSKSESRNSKTSGQRLVTEGLYGYVRHPIYTITIAAYVIAPSLTVDRVIFTLANLLYLWFAIPLEERKLIETFGEQYEHYREKVPALFPYQFWSSNAKGSSKKMTTKTTTMTMSSPSSNRVRKGTTSLRSKRDS